MTTIKMAEKHTLTDNVFMEAIIQHRQDILGFCIDTIPHVLLHQPIKLTAESFLPHEQIHGEDHGQHCCNDTGEYGENAVYDSSHYIAHSGCQDCDNLFDLRSLIYAAEVRNRIL